MKKIVDYLQRSTLRSFQNNKYIKSSYIWLLIVPFLSKIFSKLDDVLIFEIENKIYEIDLVLPFSWLIFFFAALIFSLANVLFITLAPNIIKDNKDYGDFRDKGRNRDKLDTYMNVNEKQLIEEKRFSREGRQAIGRYLNPATNDNYDYIRDEFWKIYDKRNKTKAFFRLIIGSFYLVGSLLLLYIFIQNLYWVLIEL